MRPQCSRFWTRRAARRRACSGVCMWLFVCACVCVGGCSGVGWRGRGRGGIGQGRGAIHCASPRSARRLCAVRRAAPCSRRAPAFGAAAPAARVHWAGAVGKQGGGASAAGAASGRGVGWGAVCRCTRGASCCAAREGDAMHACHTRAPHTSAGCAELASRRRATSGPKHGSGCAPASPAVEAAESAPPALPPWPCSRVHCDDTIAPVPHSAGRPRRSSSPRQNQGIKKADEFPYAVRVSAKQPWAMIPVGCRLPRSGLTVLTPPGDQPMW